MSESQVRPFCADFPPDFPHNASAVRLTSSHGRPALRGHRHRRRRHHVHHSCRESWSVSQSGTRSDKVWAKHADGTVRRTFVDHGVVEEAPRCVFHGQAVPQREVVDGEQVVFVGRSQELSVDSKIQLQVFYFEKTGRSKLTGKL